MNARVRTALRRARVAVPLAVGGLLIAACGSTGTTAGAGSSTVVSSPTAPTAPRTFSAVEVGAIVDRHKSGLEAAAKAFHQCDRKVSGDTYRAYKCLKQVRAQTAVAEELVAELGAVQLPAQYATVAANGRRLAEAGALVATRCAKVSDQKCDQALARFRADEQSVLWDLDVQL